MALKSFQFPSMKCHHLGADFTAVRQMSIGKAPLKITSPSRSRDSNPVLRVVNSSNEGDLLKQVIVGRAEGTMAQAPEPTLGRDWPEYEFPLGIYGPVPDLRA